MKIKLLFLLMSLLLNFYNLKCLAQRKFIPFEKQEKWGYRNERDQVVIGPQFIIANEFSTEGIAAVVDDSGWAYIDTTGTIIIRPFIFDNGPDYFAEGLARFTINNKFGFFDKRGKVVIRHQFDFATPFHEGLAAICKGCRKETDGEHSFMTGGQWGYIDKKGKIVIPLQFDRAGNFANGQAEVCIDGKSAYIDKNGKVIKFIKDLNKPKKKIQQ